MREISCIWHTTRDCLIALAVSYPIILSLKTKTPKKSNLSLPSFYFHVRAPFLCVLTVSLSLSLSFHILHIIYAKNRTPMCRDTHTQTQPPVQNPEVATSLLIAYKNNTQTLLSPFSILNFRFCFFHTHTHTHTHIYIYIYIYILQYIFRATMTLVVDIEVYPIHIFLVILEPY